MWEVWQGGECCHLPGSIQMKVKQDQSCGQIYELNIFSQEKQDDSDDAEVHVKIFVEFHESIEAKKAKNGLDGR